MLGLNISIGNHKDIARLLTITSDHNRKTLKKISITNLKSPNKSRIPTQSDEYTLSLSYKPKRLAKIKNYIGSMPLSNIGKASLDCDKTIGFIDSKNNKDTNHEFMPTEGNLYSLHQSSVMNSNDFRTSYIYKYGQLSESFNKLQKYIEILDVPNKNNFSNIFIQASKLLEKHSKEAFNNVGNSSNNSTINNSVENNNDNYDRKNIIAFYEFSCLNNKLFKVMFNELIQTKNVYKKLQKKSYEDELKLRIKIKELSELQKYLRRYDVGTQIFLKKTKEDDINKIKLEYGHKENEYILLIYKLEEEIRNLTKILDKNRGYFNQLKAAEKEIENNKKEIENNKSLFNRQLQEKQIAYITEKDIQESLQKELENLTETVEAFKLEKEKKKKEDIENQTLIKKLKMVVSEREETILMLNEELELYIREFSKEKKMHENTKNELTILEKKIYQESQKTEEQKRGNNKAILHNIDASFGASSISEKNEGEDESRKDSVCKDLNVSPDPTNFTRDNN